MTLNSESALANIQPLSNLVQKLNWHNPRFYKNFLAQTYYYVRHSTRMLAFAAGHTVPGQEGYFRRSVQHLHEEQGHDIIALNDLKVLGGDIREFPELSITRAMWESQFYKMQKNPTALLGYILAFEVFSAQMCSKLYETLLQAYPAEACRFIKIHGEDDPDHVEKALQQIEQLSLEEKEVIMENFHQTRDLYSTMLLACEKIS